jgi:hypothetical protein
VVIIQGLSEEKQRKQENKQIKNVRREQENEKKRIDGCLITNRTRTKRHP